MFKNVIFDWSGVVKDSFEAHVWSVGEMMKTFGGQPITPEELKNKWRQPYMDFWHMYFPDLTMEYQAKFTTKLLPGQIILRLMPMPEL